MLTPDELIVEIRDGSLVRVGQLVTDDLNGLTVVPRLNDVGSWEITLPELVLDDDGREVPHALCAALRTEGAGLIVSGPDGVILSGPMTEARFVESAESGIGQWTITGVSDTILLQDALAFPDPATADPAAQTKTNDVRTAAAEDLLRRYVAYNIANGAYTGSGWAPAGRLVGLRSKLTLYSPSLGRGPILTASPRFDNLLTLCQTIAQASGLAFDVRQEGALLVFRVWEPEDRSADVRLDVDNGALDSVELGFGAPTATRPIVAGQGEGLDRTIVERTSAAATASEELWGRRIERFYDQRNTDDLAELQQTGDTVLATEGVTVPAVRISPSSDLAIVFLRDWGLGDLVEVIVGESSSTARVTEAALVVSEGLVKTGVTIGDPTGFEPEDVQSARVTSTEQRVSSLERNAENGTDPEVAARLDKLEAATVGTVTASGSFTVNSTNTRLTKLPNGLVVLNLHVTSGSAIANGATLATLPLGFRPPGTVWTRGVGSTATADAGFTITAAGAITAAVNGTTTEIAASVTFITQPTGYGAGVYGGVPTYGS